MRRMGRRPKNAPPPDPRVKFNTSLPPELLARAKAHFGERQVGEWFEQQLVAYFQAIDDAELLAQAKAQRETS